MGCTQSAPVLMISSDESVYDFLGKNTFFKNLNSQQLAAAAKKFTIKRFKGGERIITQGEVSDSLYCVALGAVDFIAQGEDHKTKKIRTMGRHEFFGEFGLIHRTPRTVSVDAVTDVVLLVLSRAEYERSEGETCMKSLRRWVAATASSIVASGLREIPFLSDVDERQLHLIGRLFKCEVVPAAQEVAREGEKDERFYILSRGQLVLTTRDELGLYVELTRLHPGSTFGELSLIQNSVRTTTVTTLEECVLFSLGDEEFGVFMNMLPALGERLKRSVINRSIANMLANEVDVFKKMGKRKQHLLAEVCTTCRYPPGKTILEEGGMLPRKFFMIHDGLVDVLIGDKVVRTLKKPAYFGEVGLVSNSPHSATVRISDSGPAVLVECSQDDFRQVFLGEPGVLAEISLRVLGTRAPLEDVLKHETARIAFKKHVEKEFAEENIDFWLEVEELESVDRRKVRRSVLGALKIGADIIKKKKDEMLETRAMSIYKKFIAEDSSTQVNLPSELLDRIRKQVEAGDFSFNMFHDAKREIVALMSKDSFSRFQTSKEYAKLLESIGVYAQNPVPSN
eukprot:CAMPEP_0202075206 /NCGR_PEP_ID=MMETSP0964-20121228/4071_1 /ASSEMBLY_ACC=CAM_ASM_000500 /TAXON_ID=4773 /ORGANISM="Schizochytrium aggregatum, Strain ATCC28209" /LENGTH=566 /DNA_ID=CAMNT_0048642389 /DNA_START=47 /DNA_END=1747 /DNA_ORIENTATION=-